MSKIVCVVPTVRPESMKTFKEAWAPLFEKHSVTLITVWDGEKPRIEYQGSSFSVSELPIRWSYDANRDLFCRFTDACRNLGFLAAASLNPDYVLTLDDDVVPSGQRKGWNLEIPDDPIQDHLNVIQKRVPISWMNTAHDTDLYLRGFPYGIREEAPVMLSHGVWVGTPDFDGETQLRLEQCNQCEGRGEVSWPLEDGGSPPMVCPKCDGKRKQRLPHSLPYFVGPIPRGVMFPLCGMNVMVRREALPYFYFAPMGIDSGNPDLHRFADIFMGLFLKKEFDGRKWACYTGASTVLHTRASDAKKNVEQERLGRKWIELLAQAREFNQWPQDLWDYYRSYENKRQRYEMLVTSIIGK